MIAAHPKLNVNSALSIAELLSKICLNQPIFSTAVQSTLLSLIGRYLQEDLSAPMTDFTLKFASQALEALLDLEKNSQEVRQQQKEQETAIVPY